MYTAAASECTQVFGNMDGKTENTSVAVHQTAIIDKYSLHYLWHIITTSSITADFPRKRKCTVNF